MAEEEAWEGAVMELWYYDRPLDTVLSFKYLGRLLPETDDDCPAAIDNIWKARKSWFCLAWILGREGADTQTMGRFYVLAIQAILLFGSETWVMNPDIKPLWQGSSERFQNSMISMRILVA